MFTIRRMSEFDAWLNGLRDRATRIRLARRLDKAQRGNFGDVKPVGNGVFEMRDDIAAANALAATLEE